MRRVAPLGDALQGLLFGRARRACSFAREKELGYSSRGESTALETEQDDFAEIVFDDCECEWSGAECKSPGLSPQAGYLGMTTQGTVMVAWSVLAFG